MITRLEQLHSKNLIHRDIKPDNYVIGHGNNINIVHLIDFGLAKYYKDSEGNHIPFIKKRGMIGTARYIYYIIIIIFKTILLIHILIYNYILLKDMLQQMPIQDMNNLEGMIQKDQDMFYYILQKENYPGKIFMQNPKKKNMKK